MGRKKSIVSLILHQFYIGGLILFFSLQGYGQTSEDVHQNPYTVVYNHLFYLQEDSFEPSKAARSLAFGVPTKSIEKQSGRLKEILDGKGYFIDINRLPTDSMYFDSIQKAHVYILNRKDPRIYLEKRKEGWVYSRTTLEEIPQIYEELYPLGGAIKSWFVHPTWNNTILGVDLWQYLGFVILLLIAGILFYILQKIIGFIARWWYRKWLSKKYGLEIDVKHFSRLLSLLLICGFLKTFSPALHLPIRVNAVLVVILDVLMIFFVIFILIEIVRLVFGILSKYTDATENQMDDQLLPLVEKVADIIIWAVGILYLLDYMEVNVTALLAGISIGGLAIALAAQDTVKNVFGSVMIFLDKPFKIGDWISFDGIDGVVERVGIRSTRIRTFANSLTYVPNALFAERIIDNMGMRIYRRYKTTIGITYDTPPYIIDIFVEGIQEILGNHPGIRKDNFEVALNDFSDNALSILLYAFFNVDNWTDELAAKHEIMSEVIHLADALGVRFAFPTQTIFIEEMPGQKSLTPDKMSREDALNKKSEVLEKYLARKRRLDQRSVESKNLGGE